MISGSAGWPSVLHVLRHPAGGIFRHVVDLVEAQHKAGHQVGILCASTTGDAREDEGALVRLAPLLGLGLIRVAMRHELAPANIMQTWALAHQVRLLNPDILHGHGAKGGVYARAIGTRLRASGSRVARIYTPHGGSLHADRRKFRGRLMLRKERLLARATDGFVFVSEFERDAYLARVAKTRRPVTVARNGLKPEDFAPVVPIAGARDFAFIGELSHRKGLDVFIGALALMRHRSGAAPTAAIVGSGPDEQKYRTVIAELGLGEAVEFHAVRSNREAMTLAKTVVVPSRVESMPYIVLDAIAAGMPLVATRAGGIAEIFGTEADRLIALGDAAALADAMASVLAAPGAALAKAAALNIRIRSTFTVEAMAATVESLYRAVTVG
jgi:glycosyltransferase involved in cell wall biosynthesis